MSNSGMLQRKVWDGFGTALLALLLAVIVWVNATYQSDSPREGFFPEAIPIEILNKPNGLIVTKDPDMSVNVKIRAFESSWSTLTAGSFRATADWKDLTEGLHPVPIEVTCSDRRVTVLDTQPKTTYVQLERFQRGAVEAQLILQDLSDVPLGYVVGLFEVEPQYITVEGPATAVSQVAKVVVSVSLAGQRTPLERQLRPVPVDENGKPVEASALTLTPDVVTVRCDIQKKSNYREVAVRPRTRGQPARGYFVSSVEVTPATITVIGPPGVITEMGGLVDVNGEVNLAGATRDVVADLALALPEGVSVVGAPEGEPYRVTVRVGVDAVTGGSTVEAPIKIKKIRDGLVAKPSVPTVDVILTGPAVVLDELKTDLIDAYVDLGGLGVGTHQVKVQVSLLADKDPRLADLRITNISPEFVEVTIKEAPTPTPTVTDTLTPVPDEELTVVATSEASRVSSQGTPTPTGRATAATNDRATPTGTAQAAPTRTPTRTASGQ